MLLGIFSPVRAEGLREQIESVRVQRDIAQLELVELIELAELPVQFMGSA